MTWLDFGGQRSRSQQAVEVVKASTTTLEHSSTSSSSSILMFFFIIVCYRYIMKKDVINVQLYLLFYIRYSGGVNSSVYSLLFANSCSAIKYRYA